MGIEPTILVKKSDGTTVRMPLSEVKKMQGGGSGSVAVSQKPEIKVASKSVARAETPKPFVPDEYSHPFEDLVPVVEMLPSTTAPNNAFVHPVLKAKQDILKKAAAPKNPLQKLTIEPKKSSPSAPANKTIFSSQATQVARTVIQDVKPAAVEELGPVDELRTFTLLDFRRLSQNPVEAAARLGHKFLNIKDESIVQYFEALAAWKQSPLFREYIKAVSDGINSGQPLAAVTSGKEKIQVAEIKALLGMEKSFLS